jgi:polygalacturonase
MGAWRKSTYSTGDGGQCVEVADTARVVLVRDTTDRDGATLAIPAGAWQAFTLHLRS